jgi:hypothetical protein
MLTFPPIAQIIGNTNAQMTGSARPEFLFFEIFHP